MVSALNIKAGAILVYSEEMKGLGSPRQKAILLQLRLVMV